jgi:hypothetical protein
VACRGEESCGGLVIGHSWGLIVPIEVTSRSIPGLARYSGFIWRRRRLVVVSYLALLLAAFNGIWRPTPDGCVYVSLARNLAAGAGYTTNGWGWSKVHAGLPYLLAENFRLFSPTTFWPALLLNFLAGALALRLWYGLLLSELSRREALIVTLLIGINFTYSRYLYELLTDMPAFLGVTATLAAMNSLGEGIRARNRLAASGLLVCGLSLAVAMRPANWALVLLVAFFAIESAIKSRRRSVRGLALAVGAVILAAAVAGVASGSPYVQSLYRWFHNAAVRGDVGGGFVRSWGRTLDQVFGDLTLNATLGFPLVAGLSHLAAASVWAAALVACRRNRLWRYWLIVTLVMLLAYPQPQTRYLLPVLPLLALGFWRLILFLGRRLPGRIGRIAVVLIVAVWSVPNGARHVALVFQQRSSDVVAEVDNGRYVPIRTMARLTRDRLPHGVTVLSQEGIYLEAFAPDVRFLTPIDGELPPVFAGERDQLLHRRLLFAVDASPPDLSGLLAASGVELGAVLATVDRPAWERPTAPMRWIRPAAAPPLTPMRLHEVRRAASAPGENGGGRWVLDRNGAGDDADLLGEVRPIRDEGSR